MDKGIRPYCNAKFVELNNLRNRGELTNTQFRKNVIADVMEQFSITLASAATHYNHAFKTVKELNAELVSGLGRAEDKKGGRKPKAKVVAAPGGVLANMLQARSGNEGDSAEGETAQAVETPVAEVKAEEPAPVVTYSVRKVSDGTVVCSDLSLDAANALIDKAAKAKKAKLELVPA
jgi:hypothetical protein